MLIQEVMREVEETLARSNAGGGYASRSGRFARWAEGTHGSIWKRLAFILDKRTYKEWKQAATTFGPAVAHQFWRVLNNAEAYQAAYDLLADDESREIFRWRLKVRLAIPFVLRWESVFPAPQPPGVGDLSIGEAEERFCKGFRTGQYILPGLCLPEPGDVVLDLGAYVGDSAVAFCRLVGETGRVWSFEALADQYATLRKNLERFRCHQAQPLFLAAWNRNEPLFIEADRGSSRIGGGDNPVPGVRIDDFLRDQGIEHVDFIKMDIEGAEREAIEGCAETIRTQAPKLALSIYHRPGDLHVIPAMIHALRPDYRMYLRHHDPGFCDTVLYCVV